MRPPSNTRNTFRAWAGAKRSEKEERKGAALDLLFRSLGLVAILLFAPSVMMPAIMSTYASAGDIPLGSFAQVEPSGKELERRAKMAHEDR